MVATADFPQHTAGASPCAHVPEGSGSRIADYGCRFAFKDGVLWCNAIPDLPQLATCCVDMVLLAYNQFCSAERLSRQSLASFACNDSGRAHWIPNEGRGCAHCADAGTPCSQLYVYALRGPCLWSFDKRTGPIGDPLCNGTLLLTLS